MNVFLGVVEDNSSDPLKIGRCKVRVVGVHTEIREGELNGKGLTTANLPWATPLSNESIDGQSDLVVPAKGSVVLVVFLDSDQQVPIYLGTLPKIADVLPNFFQGFSDPTKEHPNSDYLKESPISRLARNDKISQTIIQTKKDTVKTGIQCYDNSFDEPETPYATVYPNNRVIETKSGHFIELDDTSGAERIHIYHRSGTMSETHNDGQLVQKVTNKRTTILVSDDNILIEGNQNIRIVGNVNQQVDGNVNQLVFGNVDQNVGGVVDITARGKITLIAPRIDLNPSSPPASPELIAVIPSGNFNPDTEPTEVLMNLVAEGHEENIFNTTGIVRAPITIEERAAYESMGITPDVVVDPQPTAIDETAPTEPVAEVPSDCADIYAAFSNNTLTGEFQLSPRFKLKNLTTNCAVSNYPLQNQLGLTPPDEACNLRKLCINILEPLADQFGVPTVTSGFRHGTNTSNHNTGSAADIQWASISDADYFDRISWIKNNLKWCELILEYGGNRPWLHVAFNTAKNNSTNFKTRVAVANGYQKGFLKLKNVPKVGGV